MVVFGVTIIGQRFASASSEQLIPSAGSCFSLRLRKARGAAARGRVSSQWTSGCSQCLKGLLAVAALEEQILPGVAAKDGDLQFVVAGADQRLLDLRLRQVDQSGTVQVGFELRGDRGWDRAFKNFDVVAAIDLEMECAGGLEQGAGVAFEGGVVEAEEVRWARRLCCGNSTKQHAREADLLNAGHGENSLKRRWRRIGDGGPSTA